MIVKYRSAFIAIGLIAAILDGGLRADEPKVVRLWTAEIPGPAAVTNGPEQDRTRPQDRLIAGRRIMKLANVSQPEMHVYLPQGDATNRAAVVICPGGGFSILAWDLEGTEVAEWLNQLGVVAVVLKYRVPTRQHGDSGDWVGPTIDVQRALSMTRSNAEQWGVDQQKIGLLGFSAGGETAARAAVSDGQRLYPQMDDMDQTPCHADFAILVYPGGIADKSGAMQDGFEVDQSTPPMFFAHAADDNATCLSSLELFRRLHQAGISAELHIYASGGHGYGLRETDSAVTKWPTHAENWLRQLQLIK